MRIISGEFKSRQLKVPKSARPTTDRMRESMFAYFEARNMLENSVILEPFAGSGAFSFEALSRGAKFCTLIDANFEAVKICKENAKTLNLSSSRIEIFKGNSLSKQAFSPLKQEYDIIFLDPPYAFSDNEVLQVIELIQNANLTNSQTMIIIESAKNRALQLPSFTLTDTKSYGSSVVEVYKRV